VIDEKIMDYMSGNPVDLPDLVFESYREIVGFISAAKVSKDLQVWTEKGLRIAYKGDYIIKDGDGNLQVCPAKVFEKTYKLPPEVSNE